MYINVYHRQRSQTNLSPVFEKPALRISEQHTHRSADASGQSNWQGISWLLNMQFDISNLDFLQFHDSSQQVHVSLSFSLQETSKVGFHVTRLL